MGKILDCVETFIKTKLPSTDYECSEERVLTGSLGYKVQFGLQDNGKAYYFQFLIDEEEETMMAICYYPDKFPTEMLPFLYPFLNHINFNQICDSAVVDPSDGELSFRIGCILDGGAVNPMIPQIAFATLLQTLTRYRGELEQLYKAATV